MCISKPLNYLHFSKMVGVLYSDPGCLTHTQTHTHTHTHAHKHTHAHTGIGILDNCTLWEP